MTEAAIKSGTLITAGLALDFGRDVFAVPGDITKETSSGTNTLIRDGHAKLTMNALDILGEYETLTVMDNVLQVAVSPKFEDPLEQAIYELLAKEPLDVSSIEDTLGADIATIAFKLSMMEVRGIVEMDMSGNYRTV